MNHSVNGFLHAQGQRMVNGVGKEVILKGWGAGNWMNPEGFMVAGFFMDFGAEVTANGQKLTLPRRYDRGRTIKSTITELCGTEYADAFFPKWYRAHLSEGDIREMARWGYNSIRLPLDAAALLYEDAGIRFNEETFSILDDVIDLCEKYKLYVILDLHGTPGHSGVPCDNGLDNIPRVFLEEETFDRMVTLWEEIARRYKDRWIVGAYELLNEPLFPAWIHLKDRLVDFYDAVISRIRTFDKQHMFLLSGPIVGTDQSIFTKDFDPKCHNWGYTFHGYHWTPEESSFRQFLETSRRLQVPCIHGEGREAVHWMPTYYEMLENWHIGYNLFCWKSEGLSGMENGPVTHDFPEGWEDIMTYLQGGPRPSYKVAQALYDKLLDLVRFENCHVKEGMFRHCMRIPPFSVGGAGYDSQGCNVSFSGNWSGGNVLNYRLADRTKLNLNPKFELPSPRRGRPGPGSTPDPLKLLTLELSAGEFACYSVNNRTSSNGFLSVQVCSNDAELLITCQEHQLQVKLPKGTHTIGPVAVTESGKQVIRIECIRGIVQVEEVAFQ